MFQAISGSITSLIDDNDPTTSRANETGILVRMAPHWKTIDLPESAKQSINSELFLQSPHPKEILLRETIVPHPDVRI
jgi:hypothetical protein